MMGQNYEFSCPILGYWVGVSGGKDVGRIVVVVTVGIRDRRGLNKVFADHIS